MHEPSPLRPASAALEPIVDDGIRFLAEILVDRELPLQPDFGLTVVDLTVIDLTVIDLTVVDLTTPTPDSTVSRCDAFDNGRGDRNSWGLHDGTATGRIVTPDHVLTARSDFGRVRDGRPLLRAVGTFYQTVSGFADEYVVRHQLYSQSPDADRQTGSADGSGPAPAKVTKDAQHRLGYFLDLGDDDFFACFRFNGDITGEYLMHVERCERSLDEQRSAGSDPELSPGRRRRRKARSLRAL